MTIDDQTPDQQAAVMAAAIAASRTTEAGAIVAAASEAFGEHVVPRRIAGPADLLPAPEDAPDRA